MPMTSTEMLRTALTVAECTPRVLYMSTVAKTDRVDARAAVDALDATLQELVVLRMLYDMHANGTDLMGPRGRNAALRVERAVNKLRRILGYFQHDAGAVRGWLLGLRADA